MPQLRQDIVTGEWVVIAPERSKRPSDFIVEEAVKATLGAKCAFCPDGAVYQKSIKKFEQVLLYVFPNDFPAFLEDPKQCSTRSHPVEDNFYNLRTALGGHDVVVIKDHDKQIFNFGVKEWRALFDCAQKRYQYWRHDCNARYSMMIYNQGPKAGASVLHPHAQIFASNLIPNRVSLELNGALHYFERSNGCVFCDLIAHEKKEKTRLIAENTDFVAFTAYAARFPFETWIVPKKHLAHFEVETVEVMESLAQIMEEVIGMHGRTLHHPSLNFFIHDLPHVVDRSDYYHWHIEIAPRVSLYGGYELGSSTIIDVMSPEEAAGYLRKS